MQELGRKRRGGRIFEGGVLAGHHGRLGIPEDAHQGGVIMSQITVCRNLGEKEGEGVFSKGAY